MERVFKEQETLYDHYSIPLLLETRPVWTVKVTVLFWN